MVHGALTVRQIIAKLKKMPPDATVAFAAHDQDSDAGEYDGIVREVEESTQAAYLRHRAWVIIR